ncbi:hypothetical protein PVAP13_3KG247700 [Panicum virgatum]|uniref:Uncharacterized protein n=1 Tax=Panicum virgatum TaxID=38727 RepID=A0A8T0UWA9_PANVG|nr:hypothetical protein PVAP13_3KG247700 [Panicum virgatum]
MNSIQYLTPPPQSTVPTRQRLSGFSHAALGFSPTSGARFSSLPALPTFQRFSPPRRSAAARDSQRPRDSVCRPPAPRVSVRCRRPRRAGELQLLLPRTPPRVAGPQDSLRCCRPRRPTSSGPRNAPRPRAAGVRVARRAPGLRRPPPRRRRRPRRAGELQLLLPRAAGVRVARRAPVPAVPCPPCSAPARPWAARPRARPVESLRLRLLCRPPI